MADRDRPITFGLKDAERIAKAVRLVEGSRGGGLGRDGRFVTVPESVVAVRNKTGFHCLHYDVVGIDQPVYDPTAGETSKENFKSRILFDGVTPAYGAHKGRFAVLRQDLQPDVFKNGSLVTGGEVGEALVAGPAVCTIDVVDLAHQYCDVKDADRTNLQSDWGGSARILWKEAGTGQRWAVVLLGSGDVGAPQYPGMDLTGGQNNRFWDFDRVYQIPGV